jgi:hypothetical protein
MQDRRGANWGSPWHLQMPTGAYLPVILTKVQTSLPRRFAPTMHKPSIRPGIEHEHRECEIYFARWVTPVFNNFSPHASISIYRYKLQRPQWQSQSAGGMNCENAKQGTSEEQETNQDLGYYQSVSSLQK